MIRTSRALTAALLACLILAGCDAGDAGRSPAPPPAARTTAADSPGPASATPSTGPAPGEVRIGELDLRNFTFTGGCGWDLPASPVRLHNGRQANATPAVDGVRSRARLTRSREITIGRQQYALAELRCTAGDQDVSGAHLIGVADGKPADLGIVATGRTMAISAADGRLRIRSSYRTVGDSPDEASGDTSYEVVVAGNTPVRIFRGDDQDTIGPAVAQWPAHGYDAGLVGINGYVYEPAESNWVVGLLQSNRRVITADTLGGYDSDCWHPTVYTQAGEKLGADHLAFAGEDTTTGTVIDLDQRSRAGTGIRGAVSLPVRKPIGGLLIPANGVVPALATVTTETAENPLADPIVTTKAPADAWQDIWRFGAASGSEFALPVGAFAGRDGRIAMTGAWFNAPLDTGKAGFGMRPLVDPAGVGEKTC